MFWLGYTIILLRSLCASSTILKSSHDDNSISSLGVTQGLNHEIERLINQQETSLSEKLDKFTALENISYIPSFSRYPYEYLGNSESNTQLKYTEGVFMGPEDISSKRVHGDTSGLTSVTLQNLMKSVLRIHTYRKYPDFGSPWQIKAHGRSSGTGFILRNSTIVTNAHVVSYAHTLKIEKPGQALLYKAKVKHIAHELDLAILTVENESFWDGLPSLELADSEWEIPGLLYDVMVIGYPTGGESIAITKGVVSRVQVGNYAHSSSEFLEIQIDAAINPGNSGGPVVNNQGHVVGIAFQGLEMSDGIGYIIPVPILRHLLDDIYMHQKFTGVVDLGFQFQTMENINLRKFFGVNDIIENIPEGVTNEGCIVIDVDYYRTKKFIEKFKQSNIESFTSDEELNDYIGFKRGDIILSIDQHDIGRDGTISLRGIERISINFLITGKYSNDTLDAVIIRDKKIKNVKVPLDIPQHLVPRHTKDQFPRYYIYAGLVFVPLTKSYIIDRKLGANRVLLAVILNNYEGVPQNEDRLEIVILSRILPSSITSGYHHQNLILNSVNGVKIKSLKHLNETLAEEQLKIDNPFVEFSFIDYAEYLVVNKVEATEQLDNILEENSIPSQWSDTL